MSLIRRHEGIVGSDLVQHAIHDYLIELVIAGIVPIVDKSAKHGTALPPVVRLRKIALNLPGFVPMIVVDEALGSDLRSSFDGI